MTASRSVYHFNHVIVREPCQAVTQGLRAHNTGNPTYEGVKAEHEAYIAALLAAGVKVEILPALENYPDSIFVEDPALVFTQGAILLRPGAPTRIGEVNEIAPTLRNMFDTVLELDEPGFADGGDVLVTPKNVMIGLSARTDQAGAEALIAALEKIGRKGEIVNTPAGVLHFKTDCSLMDDETILSTQRLASSGVFSGLRQLIVPEGEEAGANALRVNDVVLVGSDFPKTIDLLENNGFTVVALKTSEIGKIDAGLSCMSLRWYRD